MYLLIDIVCLIYYLLILFVYFTYTCRHCLSTFLIDILIDIVLSTLLIDIVCLLFLGILFVYFICYGYCLTTDLLHVDIVCFFCCLTSQVNSYAHGGTVS